MRALVFMLALLAWSAAEAQEQPSSWMLLLQTDSGAAFAPTTYETGNECQMLADRIEEHTANRTACLPAHYSESAVRSFMEKQAAIELKQQNDAAAARQRLADLEKQRPALEAERRSIVEDRSKINQQQYAKRVLEIDALLRELDN